MIRVRLGHRLGNQMFQYAAARALAERRQTTLSVDVSGYARADWSNYQLWRFRKLKLASFVRQFALSRFHAIRQAMHSTAVNFEMNGLGFDPAVNSLSGDTILRGVFTSEQYFVDYRDLISSLFNVTDFLCSDDTAALTARFPGRTAVSVHVCRGDYMTDPQFDIGNLEIYYRECFGRMLGYVPDAYFVTFSDDTDWCLRWPLLRQVDTVVMKQPRSPHRDMALMAWCRHHIITNSTFSWWAAWLGSNPAKRVFMPRRWLNRWSSQECGVSVPGWTEIDTTLS